MEFRIFRMRNRPELKVITHIHEIHVTHTDYEVDGMRFILRNVPHPRQ